MPSDPIVQIVRLPNVIPTSYGAFYYIDFIHITVPLQVHPASGGTPSATQPPHRLGFKYFQHGCRSTRITKLWFNFNTMYQNIASTAENTSGALLHKVFGWMFVGLIVSALTAYWVAVSPTVLNVVLGNQAVFFGLIIVELALVVGLTHHP